MNSEWRLHFIWPSLISWFSGANFTAGLMGYRILNIVIGILTLATVIYIVYNNQKDYEQ